jgi:hypothetical protein
MKVIAYGAGFILAASVLLELYFAPQVERAVLRLPVALYVISMIATGRAFGQISRAEPFSTVLPPLLMAIGATLSLAAFTQTVVTPLLLRMLDATFVSILIFDSAAVALGVIGLFIIVISRLIAEATKMRDELSGFV